MGRPVCIGVEIETKASTFAGVKSETFFISTFQGLNESRFSIRCFSKVVFTNRMETRLRILHLEDSPEDAELVQMALAHAGIPHNLKAVATKEDFIVALAGLPFDVILSDGNVRGFDGATALTLVQEQHRQIPFFFVSGSMPTDK